VELVPESVLTRYMDCLEAELQPVDFMPNPCHFLVNKSEENIRKKKEEMRPDYVRLYQLVKQRAFRSIGLSPDWLHWNDGTVARIAQAIYDERAFERLPVLADALEDAGCDNADILSHCRSDGPHVRGCWVVDLLLGKS